MSKSFLRNKKIVLRVGEQYDFPVTGNAIRVVSASVPIYFKTRDGDLDFYLEQGEKATFEGQEFLTLTIYHLDASDQTVIISVGRGADVGSAKVSGNVLIANAVALDSATLAALENTTIQNLGCSYGSSYKSSTILTGGTPEVVFTPAANVNGAIIHSANFWSNSAAAHIFVSLLAKVSAPANVNDGDVMLGIDGSASSSGNFATYGSLKNPIRIPAGKGLYFISANTEASGVRNCLYTML